ncbi:MAG TPA: hypothetical protein VMT16_14475, partial [Thermoanaerobaculia bacterium]|nr:hypothetical protein [Thermoanaerobaculia bacterium]
MREPGRRTAQILLLPLLLTLAALPPAIASEPAAEETDETGLGPDQTADEWEQSRYSAARYEARVKLFGTSYQNYFRVPDDRDATTVSSFSVEGRVTLTLDRERRIKTYLQAQRENFQEATILTSPTFSLGLRGDGDRHGFDAAVRYLENRELRDVDDDAEPADIYIYFAAYRLRFAEDWEWNLEGEMRDQSYSAPRRGEDSELLSGNLSLRYRGFGRRFSPEVGYERRQRDALDPHDEYAEDMAWAKLRFSPARALTFSLRYRDRRRDYRVEDPGDSNFGRDDDRDEWTLRGDWVVSRRWALNLEADHLDTDSTRQSRVFTTSQLTLGVALKVGPLDERRTRTQPGRPADPPPPCRTVRGEPPPCCGRSVTGRGRSGRRSCCGSMGPSTSAATPAASPAASWSSSTAARAAPLAATASFPTARWRASAPPTLRALPGRWCRWCSSCATRPPSR